MPPPAGPPLVFVTDVERPELDAGDRHHLERVLRVRAGDAITVSDGAGRWRPCRLAPEIEPAGAVVVEPRPSPTLAVAIALTKGDRPELAVQKLTEVGVDEIVLFRAGRSVVRWDDGKSVRNLERLRKVAREAGMQSRRAWLPHVDGVAAFADVARRPGAALADRDGDPPSLEHSLVLVGPEGGWTDEERAAPLPRVCLGSGVLRAETAAVAAGVLLVNLRLSQIIPHLRARKR